MILAQIKYTEEKPINIVSLVSKGANKENFIKLSEEKPIVKLSTNDELQEVTGVVLIPNQRIYRTEEFFEKTLGIKEDGEIFFSAEDIKSFALDYLKNAENGVNLEHSKDVNEDAVQLVESWLITTDNDKAYDLGFDGETVIMGTWMMTQKINDDDLWVDVKAGVYNGFSVEGSPIVEAINLELRKEYSEDEIVNEIVQIIIEDKRMGEK